VRDLLPRPTRLDASGLTQRLTSVVLNLLYDLTQQAACIGSGTQSWASLAAYDADDYASFTRGGEA